MKGISQLFRFIHISFILSKYGIDEILLTNKLPIPFLFLFYLNPLTWIRNKKQPRGVRIRLALEALGPIFVKFGQMLSTRPDLIPEDIVAELILLQDKVPGFKNVKNRLENIYQQPLSSLFLEFDETPFASASVAQVHAATLMDGKKVVVKVLRPNIETTIKQDIDLLYTFAFVISRWPGGKRLKPREIIAEFEHSILNELDFMREAANASLLRRHFKQSSLLYVPEIYWPYTRSKLLVMERIYGIPVTDIEQLKAMNVNLKTLAERGVEIFFTQVFKNCFFHADMHPGNIFVSVSNPSAPSYIAVDFGIMGSLSPQDQRYLAENLLAFFKRDYRKVAQLHIDSGWVPSSIRLDEFEASIRTVCEPIFERPLKDISFGYLLLRLFQTGKQFHMEIQPQLLLLQKTLIHVEGLGRQLYPELDLWATAKPFLENWLKEQVGPKALWQKVKSNFPYWMENLPELPKLIHQTLLHFQNEEIRNKEQDKQHKKQQASKILSVSTQLLAGLSLVFLLSGILHIILANNSVPMQLYNILGWSLIGVSGLLAIFSIYKHK